MGVNDIFIPFLLLESAYLRGSLVGRVSQDGDKAIHYFLVPKLVHLGDCLLAEVSYSGKTKS